MQSIEMKVKSRIYGKGRGWCFTQKDFLDLGSSDAVRQSLSRFEKSGFIRRLAHGLYEYPKSHPTLGVLPPDIESIAKAISTRDDVKVQPSGAYAANLLGLSTQVPARVVFLTDGKTKKVKVGKTEIVFKKTTPKDMKTAGTISGLVIQALKYLGKSNADQKVINTLQSKLSKEELKRLKLDRTLAPVWIGKIIEEISKGG